MVARMAAVAQLPAPSPSLPQPPQASHPSHPSSEVSVSPSLRSTPPPPRPSVGSPLVQKAEATRAIQATTFLAAAEAEGVSELSKEPTALLQAAARVGDIVRIKSSITAGGDVNSVDTWGLSPLHSAVLGGHTEAVKFLLENHADVDKPNFRAQTALHLAAFEGDMEVVRCLIDNLADVTKKTNHGLTPLDTASQRANGCAQAIREELARRYQDVKRDAAELRRRLAAAESIQTLIETQMAQPQEDAPADERTPAGRNSVVLDAKKMKPLGKKGGGRMLYWWGVQKAVEKAHEMCKEATEMAWVRDQACVPADIPHYGPHSTTDPAAMPDSDDEDLLAGYHHLGVMAEEAKKRAAFRHKSISPEDAFVKQHNDKAMIESTSRTQEQWEAIVAEITTPGYVWDFSKIEVRARTLMLPKRVWMDTHVCFAVDTRDAEPVFRQGDILGPIGGTVRRRVRYEQLYYPGHKWKLHDPLVYSFVLRAQTMELKFEPLVIDMFAGRSQNRLRYLGDARRDPMGVRACEATAKVESVAGVSTRGSMPRVRSRPGSPARPGSPGSPARAGEQSQNPASHTESSLGGGIDEFAIFPNTKIVEVIVRGWPYAFAVATEDIFGGQELAMDLGDIHWHSQRASIDRLRGLGKLADEFVRGRVVDGDDDADEEGTGEKEKEREPDGRAPMTRVVMPGDAPPPE